MCAISLAGHPTSPARQPSKEAEGLLPRCTPAMIQQANQKQKSAAISVGGAWLRRESSRVRSSKVPLSSMGGDQFLSSLSRIFALLARARKKGGKEKCATS